MKLWKNAKWSQFWTLLTLVGDAFIVSSNFLFPAILFWVAIVPFTPSKSAALSFTQQPWMARRSANIVTNLASCSLISDQRSCAGCSCRKRPGGLNAVHTIVTIERARAALWPLVLSRNKSWQIFKTYKRVSSFQSNEKNLDPQDRVCSNRNHLIKVYPSCQWLCLIFRADE